MMPREREPFLTKIKRFELSIPALAVIATASRLPFLGVGYGSDPDAWRVANNAKIMAASGVYSWSRPPGLPVHEIISALLYNGGPWMLNGATALFSIIAIVFFALSLRRMNIRHYFLAGLMLAFVPLVYISSTILMDYMWALGFAMLSLYFVIGRRSFRAGVCMGLAIGCRLTSGALILPLAIILIQSCSDFSWRTTAGYLGRFLLATGITAAIAFYPVISKYGSGFFSFYDAVSPPVATALHRATFEVWGILGTFLLVAIIVAAAILPKLLCLSPGGDLSWRRYVRPALIAIVLYFVAFLRLPVEAAYLIPAIPFVILLMAGSLKRWVMIIACAAMIITSFADMTCPTCYQSWQQGPFLRDYLSRSRGIAFVNRILSESKNLPTKSAIVVAWWEPHLRLLREDNPADSIAYVYCLDSARLQEWNAKGYAIYHLPYVADYNKTNYGVDLTEVSSVLNIPY